MTRWCNKIFGCINIYPRILKVIVVVVVESSFLEVRPLFNLYPCQSHFAITNQSCSADQTPVARELRGSITDLYFIRVLTILAVEDLSGQQFKERARFSNYNLIHLN